MASLIRGSSVHTLGLLLAGKAPTFSRSGADVKDLEKTIQVTDEPLGTDSEKDEPAGPDDRVQVVTWNGKDDPEYVGTTS
jgi:hypothetical protein